MVRNNPKSTRHPNKVRGAKATQGLKQLQQREPGNLNIHTLSFTPTGVFMPQTFRTTMIYYEQVNFTAVTQPQIYVYRLNGPFDPSQTGTGSQPQGYDNFSTFYEQLFTVGSKMKLLIVNRNTNVIQVGLAATPQTTTITDWTGLVTYPGSRIVNIDSTTSGSASFKEMTMQQATLAYFHEDFNSDYLTPFTGNPGKQLYWTIAIHAADGASALSFSLLVEIHYDVVCTTPKLVALS